MLDTRKYISLDERSKDIMRKTALCAGIAQLLYGTYAVAPELFGVGRMPVPNQFLDCLVRSFFFVASIIFAVFFLVVYRNATSLNLFGAVRFASVVTAAALIVENLLPTYFSIKGAVAAADNLLGWKYHPFKQLVHVLVPIIPTLAVVTLVVFLLFVFSVSLKSSTLSQSPTSRGRTLRLVSFAVATVSVLTLAGFLYSLVATPQLHVSTFRLLLRFVTLVSFVLFFFLLGANQQSGKLQASAQ